MPAMAITLLDVVRWRHRYPEAPRPISWYTLPAHVLSLHLRASGNSIIGGEHFDLKGPFLSLAAAGERDGNQMRGLNDAWWCFFACPGLASLPGGGGVELRLGDMTVRRSHHRRLSTTAGAELGTRFAHALAAWKRADLASQLEATAIITGILAAWCAPPEPTDAADHGLAARYRVLIEETATDAGISLGALVRRMGRSDDRLSILFREAYGLSPVAYRLKLRLAVAAELLAFTDLPMREIARRSGFGTPTHLSHAFRQHHGVSPRAWAQARSREGPVGLADGRIGGRQRSTAAVRRERKPAATLPPCPGMESNDFAESTTWSD